MINAYILYISNGVDWEAFMYARTFIQKKLGI